MTGALGGSRQELGIHEGRRCRGAPLCRGRKLQCRGRAAGATASPRRWVSSPALLAGLHSSCVPHGRPACDHGRVHRDCHTALGRGPRHWRPSLQAHLGVVCCLLPSGHLRHRCCRCRPLLPPGMAAGRTGQRRAAAYGAFPPPPSARGSRRPRRCWPPCRCRAAAAATCPRAWRGQHQQGSRGGAPAGAQRRRRQEWPGNQPFESRRAGPQAGHQQCQLRLRPRLQASSHGNPAARQRAHSRSPAARRAVHCTARRPPAPLEGLPAPRSRSPAGRLLGDRGHAGVGLGRARDHTSERCHDWPGPSPGKPQRHDGPALPRGLAPQQYAGVPTLRQEFGCTKS